MANEVVARYVVFLRENLDEESRNELNTDWDHVSTSIFNNGVHSFAYKMGVVIRNVDRLIYDSGNKYVQSLVDEATTGGIGYFQSKFQVLCVWFIFDLLWPFLTILSFQNRVTNGLLPINTKKTLSEIIRNRVAGNQMLINGVRMFLINITADTQQTMIWNLLQTRVANENWPELAR
jgi:hypothetical protein